VNEFRLFSWLNQQEDIHRMVLYQCDYQLTLCCNSVTVLSLSSVVTFRGLIEKELESIAVRAQKELILLHKEDAETVKNTTEWLNLRGWLSSHHHLRCPKRVLKITSAAKTLETYERVFETQPDRMADFSRLARFLTGNSITLVLGGGGARGLAHVGMIKAMQDEGIPIDVIGGTSIGAFIGALWAEERNFVRFKQRAREWSTVMNSWWKKIWDLTYPFASMFTGSAFNESIENVFHDRQIEDLWIPYFCITTNISNSTMRVHSSGSLWRYVRASMSLAGYLPPLCDPVDGHLILDGGYVNNLPGTVGLEHFQTVLSGSLSLWMIDKVPDMTEIQSRLAYVSCVRQLEVVKNSDYCEYIRPPIDRYGTLQFGSFDDIAETGYHHGKTLFSAWNKGGLLEKLFQETEPPSNEARYRAERNIPKSHVPGMAYFTDLAEQVSRIEKPRNNTFYPSEDDSDEEVIYENDEDEELGHMLDRLREEEVFAHTDGDDDAREDGAEKSSGRRQAAAHI
ncbi:unnamed protein product, partial [Candidula unifasciata]